MNDISTQRKKELIALLRGCNYRTPPKIVAEYLDELLGNPETQPGHWNYYAKYWPPRSINLVIARMVKEHNRGELTAHPGGSVAKYFTFLIEFYEKRKKYEDMKKKRREITSRYKKRGRLSDEIDEIFEEPQQANKEEQW